MRKVKFRAWSEYSNKLVVWEHMKVDETLGGVLNGEDEKIHVMQFTGLKDKNGREIYEGDILTSKHYPFQRDGEYNYHVLVEWGNEQAAYYLTKYLANKNRHGVSHLISDSMEQYNMATFEIIGNIHENPELLEADY